VNDQRYSPAERYWLGRYFYLHQGGILLDFDFLKVKAGRFIHRDVIDSPYSLFISSQDEQPAHWFWQPGLPAILADFTFQGGPFLYESRWIQLNARSANNYPDRGANYKVFALQFGDFRFGLQDSAVYVDRIFDAEYFFSPMPHIFTQIARNDGKPWSEDINDNTLVGLFVEWQKPLYYLYAQWLVDDISLSSLVPEFLKDIVGGNLKIPSKLAWSLGGYYDFSFGRLGFYHAGATKYTFSPPTDVAIYPYQYTYYPAVDYQLKDSTVLTLDYVDNYIGYKYGENNLAFQFDYSNTFSDVEFSAMLEYVISGSKSPANPWHEFADKDAAGRDTRLLDDPVLEHTISTRVAGSWSWRNLTLYTLLRLGGVFNKLELEPAADGDPDIFRPQPGLHKFIYQWTVGATYRFNIGKDR
jgi:hypothetical protein